MLPVPLQMPSGQYPVHPDVKLKKLPFFDLLAELLKPSSLMPQGSVRVQENTFMFHLTPQQSNDIASSRDCRAGSKMDYMVQVNYLISDILYKLLMSYQQLFLILFWDIIYRYR